MGESSWCKTCGRFMLYPDTHRCPPLFDARWEECDDDEWEQFREYDHDKVAERYAERRDADGDYNIVSGSDIIVLVRKHGEDDIKRFNVSGHSVPEYTATEEPLTTQESIGG